MLSETYLLNMLCILYIVYLSITIQSDVWVCILYTTFLYTTFIKRWDILMLVNCYWLKSLGIHCLYYALCLFLLETNSKIKQVPNYSRTYKAEDKKKFKKYNITQLCILYARDKKQLRGRQQFTLSFFNLTTLKTLWYPKLRYNILFSTLPTSWSFYMGPHFTFSMEPLVFKVLFPWNSFSRRCLKLVELFLSWIQRHIGGTLAIFICR